MKKIILCCVLGFIAFSLLMTFQARAGQVVTDEVRGWARRTLQEEKALKTAEGRNTVAVLYFQNKTGQPDLNPLQKGFALMLITDLSKVSTLQVVSFR